MIDEEEDYEEDEKSDGFIISFDEEGKKTKLTSKKDYENTIGKQQELITEFIRENLELFKKFLDKKCVSEEEFNGGSSKC